MKNKVIKVFLLGLFSVVFSCSNNEHETLENESNNLKQNETSKIEQTNSGFNNSNNTTSNNTLDYKNTNAKMVEPSPSSTPVLTEEEKLKLLQPTESELNNKTINTEQNADQNTL